MCTVMLAAYTRLQSAESNENINNVNMCVHIHAPAHSQSSFLLALCLSLARSLAHFLSAIFAFAQFICHIECTSFDGHLNLADDENEHMFGNFYQMQ